MPTYVYKFVDTGETIEVQQSFTDATLTEFAHPQSGDVMAVKKVFTPVGVTFKGSGFFKTDNRGGKAKSDSGTGDSKSSDSKSGDSKGGDSTSKDSSKGSSKDSSASGGSSGGSSTSSTKTESGSTTSSKKTAATSTPSG